MVGRQLFIEANNHKRLPPPSPDQAKPERLFGGHDSNQALREELFGSIKAENRVAVGTHRHSAADDDNVGVPFGWYRVIRIAGEKPYAIA